jgi:hypothetical protein
MDASVKSEWIDRHKAEQREREEQERGRRVERGLLIAYVVTQVAAAGLIHAQSDRAESLVGRCKEKPRQSVGGARCFSHVETVNPV